LDYGKAETADNDEGAENLGQVGERVEIGHALPRAHSLAPPGGLEPPTRVLGKQQKYEKSRQLTAPALQAPASSGTKRRPTRPHGLPPDFADWPVDATTFHEKARPARSPSFFFRAAALAAPSCSRGSHHASIRTLRDLWHNADRGNGS
jgi:hypothetical protein